MQVDDQVEDVVVEQELTPEEAQAEEDAGFAASFGNEVRAVEAPAEVEPEAVVEEAEPEVEVVSEEDKAAAEILAKLSRLDEIKNTSDLSAADVRKLHGKIGELNRDLLALKTTRTGVKFDATKLKRLSEEYPDLAEAFASDFSEMFDNKEQPPAVDYEAKLVQAKEELRDEMRKDMHKNLLLIQHADALDVFHTDEFNVWKQAQPADVQAQLNDSWDATYLVKQLTAFKDWQGKKNTGSNGRTELLKRALTPKGSQLVTPKSTAMTELDGFNAAFKT